MKKSSLLIITVGLVVIVIVFFILYIDSLPEKDVKDSLFMPMDEPISTEVVTEPLTQINDEDWTVARLIPETVPVTQIMSTENNISEEVASP